MSNLRRDLRLVAVPAEIRDLVATRVRELGPKRAAQSLGITRDLAVSVLAGLNVMPGSLALLREAKGRAAA